MKVIFLVKVIFLSVHLSLWRDDTDTHIWMNGILNTYLSSFFCQCLCVERSIDETVWTSKQYLIVFNFIWWENIFMGIIKMCYCLKKYFVFITHSRVFLLYFAYLTIHNWSFLTKGEKFMRILFKIDIQAKKRYVPKLREMMFRGVYYTV